MILFTGFEPFGDRDSNPSMSIARQAASILEQQGIATIAAELPCVFATAPAMLEELLATWQPRVVISLGLAEGRGALGLEKVAINHLDARIADNAGDQPIDLPVLAGGPAAYFSGLPLKSALQALRDPSTELGDVEAEISYSAGTFVCNQVFYSLMHHAGRAPGLRAGFIHVPWMDPAAPRIAIHARAVACVAQLALAGATEPRLGAGTEY
ncbi:pyroglutamyl-peptidase I [Paeniglutamicibacter sulfureus]|uniref:pyroglutamyl-peptidase I family protein n=1 Tax=Paeniglutamicibacter sulfureus TaxID=43666 RepID=UPI00266719EA|nr:pyroglutamyl-peptidase I [Paeniglutamicibacter sulfureus]MDO2932876.1 pyroglutamyl-peptidase I [Paeniglutamicibacter sulfureus]